MIVCIVNNIAVKIIKPFQIHVFARPAYRILRKKSHEGAQVCHVEASLELVPDRDYSTESAEIMTCMACHISGIL